MDTAGRIAGEGYHARKGDAHAEAQALAIAGPRARQATAVVTLEPCHHYGRTPPCREALITAGVRRVVIAVIDPTSRGEGGAVALAAAGVDVEVGVLSDEARVILAPWLTALATRRPVITWPYLITADTIAPLSRISSEWDRLRLNADAVLAADGSVREAIPNSHGTGILQLKKISPGTDPLAAEEILYDGGVRNLLLDGGPEFAVPFLGHQLIEHVIAYIPGDKGYFPPNADLPWLQLPPGFSITGTAKLEGFARLHARRSAIP